MWMRYHFLLISADLAEVWLLNKSFLTKFEALRVEGFRDLGFRIVFVEKMFPVTLCSVSVTIVYVWPKFRFKNKKGW